MIARLTTRFVTLVVAGTVSDPSLTDAITGDLVEDCTLVARARGRLAAAGWLLSQLVTSVPHFASLVPQRAGECFTARAVARFYASMAMVIALSVALVLAFDWAAPRSASPTQLTVALTFSIAASMLAGFSAAHSVKRLALVAAFAVGLSSLAIGIGGLLQHDVHASPAFWLGALGAVIPASLAGGLIRAWQLARGSSLTQ